MARGEVLAVALAPGVGLGLAAEDGRTWALPTPEPHALVAEIERACRPRWLWWNGETPAALVDAGVRVGMCWDVAAVHRLLFGGWRAEPARVWARLHDRPTDSLPGMGQMLR